jgi:two-component system chemotaxis sensor kinase CheA
MDNNDLKELFISECYEMIEDMEKRLIGMETDTNVSPDVLNAIFRGAHSMKGGAGALGFEKIYKFTHGLEALLDALRSGQKNVSIEIIDILLAGVDIVRQMVDAENAGAPLPCNIGHDILSSIETLLATGVAPISSEPDTSGVETTADTGMAVYNITFQPQRELFGSGNDPLFVFKQLQGLGNLEVKADLSSLPTWDNYNPQECYMSWSMHLETEAPEASIKEAFEFVDSLAKIDITKEAAIVNEATTEAINTPAVTKEPTSPEQAQQEKATQASSATVRVDVDKIDIMMNMVGELVISQSMLIVQIANLPLEMQQNVQDSLNDLSRKTRELQGAVMSVRMQPVQSVFSRMTRLSRDLSRQLNKPFRLVTSGEGTEVDKTIIEKLSDPITHMIRNAADHGLEMPEERIKNGKPAEGVINLSAYHAGGKIVIEIADDGAGIKRDKVLEKARSKGLVPPDADLTPDQIDSLIFLPGFSTADSVSTISGRGVGMDVVDKNIKELGGGVSIHNSPGKGLKFIITLPLTLAILDGMVVSVGTEKYIIPIVNIIETLRSKDKDIKTIIGGNDLLNIRGEFIPILYLYKLFNIVETKKTASEGFVVLIENGRNKFGLVVDSLLGQQQVVIKTIDDQGQAIPGVSGATILGDGKISLILDVSGIYTMIDYAQPKSIEANCVV